MIHRLHVGVIGLAIAGIARCSLPAETPPAGRALPVALPSPDLSPTMQLGILPSVPPAPKDNPATAAKVALGRLLFFDPILSSTKDVSCATCHNPRFGWTDGRATPIGIGGSGVGPARTFRRGTAVPLLPRNVPTILNVGFNGLVAGEPPDPAVAPMFWDSRGRGLEQQVFTPLLAAGEMRGEDCSESEMLAQIIRRLRAIGEYRGRFAAAFGQAQEEAITPDHLAQAIAAFERSLVTPNTAFDRFLAGADLALSADQRRGLNVFQDAGCNQCHGGPMFSDFKLHFIGVNDATVSGQREFRTPTLRNLRQTGPYMHDGSRRTLHEVLVFYDDLAESVTETIEGGDATGRPRLDPLLKQLRLKPADFRALEAFLDALSSNDYDQTSPTHVPSGLPVVP